MKYGRRVSRKYLTPSPLPPLPALSRSRFRTARCMYAAPSRRALSSGPLRVSSNSVMSSQSSTASSNANQLVVPL
eukprot:2846566-Amphidinium_carterae.1